MPKEKSINPAQAQRKAEKARAIKKGKAEATNRRNEKLARRNPQRLQKQLDDLKALESSGGKLTSHEQRMLEELEKDLKAVKKAREALGDRAPNFGNRIFGARGGDGVLGKRRRDDELESDESDIPEDLKSIPMPRDTPPPIPKEIMDEWHQTWRERHGYGGRDGQNRATNANRVPLGGDKRRGVQLDGLPSGPGDSALTTPAVEPKTVYEAAPAIRDLRKEAVAAFVPAAVRLKMEKSKGLGGLVEPEEADMLEKEGYLGKGARARSTFSKEPRAVTIEEVEDEDD